jgi:hypothetical protein
MIQLKHSRILIEGVRLPTLLPSRMRTICATALLAGLSVVPASADFISDTLGSAGPADWSLLEIDGGNVSLAGAPPNGFITGNVGLNGGNFSDSNVPITGNLVYGTAASGISSATGLVTGSITENQALLTSAASAATSASSTFSSLMPTLSNMSITGTTTINLAPGVNVADLTAINLGGSDVLTLNGPAGSEVIFNSSGGLTLNSGRIVLTGGLTPSDVVFNLTGGDFATSGGLNNESVLSGIVLDLNGQVHLTPGAVTGEVIGGQNINIASGGSIKGVPAIPESNTIISLITAVATWGFLSRRKLGGLAKRTSDAAA